MSRIESGRMHLEEQACDFINIVDDVATVFSDQMRAKQLEFTVDTSGITGRHVMCDRVRLSRILMNLISNAYKFTPEGGRVEVICTQETGEDGTSEYIIRVRDNGIGMTEEFAAKVFDSFERERTSTVSSLEGTGLGMAITRSIAEMMGGSISVETEKDRGTEFTVRLPLKGAEYEPAPAEEGRMIENNDCGCAESLRILLVEDVEVNREIAAMILRNMGFCIETACNGAEAVEMVMNSKPGYYAAVLMDVQMPVMNGYEATGMIRALEDPDLASIPVIAVTANAFAEDVQEAADAGMDGHIAKPLDQDNIRKVLRPIVTGYLEKNSKPGELDSGSQKNIF